MTAASMAGAWKAYLEAQGLGVPWYRDAAPAGVDPPFGTVLEGVGYAEPRTVPGGDVVLEQVQIDLWQPARATSAGGTRTVNVESYTLPEDVARLIRSRGVALFAPWHVYGVTVAGRRWPASDNVVRHTWTATVTRNRDRKAA